MLKSFTVKNFKSFREATLPLAPLTVLIGANASGKSNAIEALKFLSWLASGELLEKIHQAIRDQKLTVRAGALNDLLFDGELFSFGCQLDEKNDRAEGAFSPALDFQVSIRVGDEGLRIVAERLAALTGSDRIRLHPLYEVEGPAQKGRIPVVYSHFKTAGPRPGLSCIDQQAVFTQLATPALFQEERQTKHPESPILIPAATSRLQQNLSGILFLDPDPRRMRELSYLDEKELKNDGSALSSVLRRLVEEEEKKGEVLEFIQALPEQNIRNISFRKTDRREVVVRLHESFGGEVRPREAPLLSDGTLRALAIAAALLSVPEGSMVVIEEVDNGVHPSRAEMLLKRIQQVAKERRLRVLLTTHNPALLDAVPLEAVPDTVACYRDPKEGDSRMIRLEDLASYPELVAQGPLGSLVTRGVLDRFLKDPAKRDKALKVEKGLAWLSDFRRKVESA